MNTYGTFEFKQTMNQVGKTMISIMFIITGLIICVFPFISGILIGIYYPSNITDCSYRDIFFVLNLQGHSIDMSLLKSLLFIGSIIELPIILCYYYYFAMSSMFINHEWGRTHKSSFYYVNIIFNIIIIIISILGWIEFAGEFGYCFRPPVVITSACIGVFGVPLSIVLASYGIYCNFDD